MLALWRLVQAQIRLAVSSRSLPAPVITALSDGLSRLPPMFYPGLDPCHHESEVGADGTVHIPTGCFLIRGSGRTILVDAGLGPLTVPYPEGMPTATIPGQPAPPLSEGGQLPDQLRAIGCDPSEVDTVMLTQAHGDHIGWVAPDGSPYFGKATVLFGAADWETLVDPADDAEPGIAGLKAAREAGRMDALTDTSHDIAPGVSIEHAPGHTPGSYVVIVSAPNHRTYLLGDVIQHPLQLNDDDISFLTDADAALAMRTRRALVDRLLAEEAFVGMDHFPTGAFQRTVGTAPRVWQAVS
jgi:glyoxylase-like metal-dependent hydrolase (beta-lactamase superfamily II)